VSADELNAETLMPSIACEGCADHFMGRPLDANPYCKRSADVERRSWRFGWLEGSWYREMREEAEVARWRR
jgi:hypothetical protein